MVHIILQRLCNIGRMVNQMVLIYIIFDVIIVVQRTRKVILRQPYISMMPLRHKHMSPPEKSKLYSIIYRTQCLKHPIYR